MDGFDSAVGNAAMGLGSITAGLLGSFRETCW